MLSVFAVLGFIQAFSYDEDWSTMYPEFCADDLQSPIDIPTDPAESDYSFNSLESAYSFSGEQTLVVDDYTLTVNTNNEASTAIGYGNSYYTWTLESISLRWGGDNTEGSEHSLGGVFYPLEMQLFHRDLVHEIEYDKLVYSVFFEVGDSNSDLQALLDELPAGTITAGTEVSVPNFVLSTLDLTAPEFYFYDGSMTTPMCEGGVRWMVSNSILTVSSTQLDTLRAISYQDENGDTSILNTGNFRATQDLQYRRTYRNFGLPFAETTEFVDWAATRMNVGIFVGAAIGLCCCTMLRVVFHSLTMSMSQ